MKSIQKAVYMLIGACVAIVLSSTVVPALASQIEASFNAVNVSLNGKQVAAIGESYTLSNGDVVPFSILYKGTTYLPMRKLCELLDLEIAWNGDTKTAEVGSASSEAQSPTDSKPTVPPLSAMSYDEFRKALTLKSESGERLSAPYDVKIGETRVAAPAVIFFFTLGSNLDEELLSEEWRKLEATNLDRYLDLLFNECGKSAPYNSIQISISYNDMNELFRRIVGR